MRGAAVGSSVPTVAAGKRWALPTTGGLHSAAMLVVAGLAALVVYQKLDVEGLRCAWVNVDLVRVGTLVVTGTIALGLGLFPGQIG